MNTFKFLTLGCKVNQYETEAMEEIFKNRGYKEAVDDNPADVYIINTCTVTNMSDRKSRNFISRAKRSNENAIIAVVGCYSQVSPSEIEGLDDIDLIMGTQYRNKIVDLVEQAKSTNEQINVVGKLEKGKEFDELSISEESYMDRAYIKIQEGCNMFCTYCIIPYARGPITSRNFDSIIKEARRLSENGFEEVILTGIHIASYGKEVGGPYLIDVIEEISKIDKIKRIRLSSIEPRLIDKDFLDRLVKTKTSDHFHLSLQSGSDDVLKRMNRKYNTEEYKNIVELIRKYYPNRGITTDIICGFPGETDENFEETKRFVEEIKFSRIHIFPYSKREGTPAYSFKNQVDGNIKKQRTEDLSKIEEKYRYEFMDKQIGGVFEVLFEEATDKDGYMSGYTTNYCRVKKEYDPRHVSKILKVKIISRDQDELIGEVIKK